MEKYRSLNGHSGVECYMTGPDFITVGFRNGTFRMYTYESAGPDAVEKMKDLAASGQGLNSYIESSASRKHARQWREKCG